MQKKLRMRLGSILLSAAMLLSLLPVTALAAEAPGNAAEEETSVSTVVDEPETSGQPEVSGPAVEEEADVDTNWYNGAADTYTISDAAELAGLAQLVNEGNSFKDKTIQLGADIDLANREWTPIGGAGTNKAFAGTFEGNDRTISNLKITKGFDYIKANEQIGLFGACTSTAALQNFNLCNVDVTGSGNVAAVLGGSGGAEAKITNVHVSGSVKVYGYWYVGGIMGKGYSTITNCSIEGDGINTSYVKGYDATDGSGYVGGIVGYMGEGNCVTTGCTVKNITVSGAHNGIGGVNGILHYGNTIKDCTLKNVVVWQTTEPEESDGNRIYCGAFAGTYLDNGGKNCPTIKSCEFTGELYSGADKNDILEADRYVGSLWYGAEPPATVNIEDCKIHMPPVAQIGETTYQTLEDAIQAAMEGDNKTVKLLKSVTIDTWNQVWDAKDLTILGNGRTVTVKKVESNGNGNYLFYRAENLNISNLTVNLPAGGNGFSMESGKLEDVTVTGGTYAVATGVAPSGQQVEIKNCIFTGQTEMAIYTQEQGKAANTVIDNCTFNSDRAVVLRNNEQFTNNTVNGSKGVTINKTATATVTGNTFAEDSRLKLYDTASDIEKNKLLGNVELDESVPDNSQISLNKNYWGKDRTPSSVLGDSASKVDGGNTNYYLQPTMEDDDLNTYVPSGGGSSHSGDYLISVDKTTGGKVTVTPGRADKGDTVTIIVKPDSGYVLDELTVTDKDGDSIKLTEKDDNKFTFKMPGSKVTVEATFVQGTEENVLPFLDVDVDDWFYDAVVYAYENDLMSGTSANTFAPNSQMTRAMIWTVLAANDGVNTSGGAVWYEKGQKWAMDNGVSDGSDPDGSITREQMAVMLWRCAGSPKAEKSLTSYTDASSVSQWAVEAMAWAVENGLISGMGDGILAPQGNATRAQVATIMMQFVELGA